jgi:hypothetical protein
LGSFSGGGGVLRITAQYRTIIEQMSRRNEAVCGLHTYL